MNNSSSCDEYSGGPIRSTNAFASSIKTSRWIGAGDVEPLRLVCHLIRGYRPELRCRISPSRPITGQMSRNSAGPLPFWRRPVYATRRSAHVVFAIGVWPSLTLIGSWVTLINNPYFSVDDIVALQAALAGLAFSLPEMVLAGILVFGLSGFIFKCYGPDTDSRDF